MFKVQKVAKIATQHALTPIWYFKFFAPTWKSTNLLASGDTLLALMGARYARQTDRIWQRNPDVRLFQTPTSICVEIYGDAFGGKKQRSRSRITAAKRRDFAQDLGDIYSARSGKIELANNISYNFLKGATYQNGQLAFAENQQTLSYFTETDVKTPKLI